MKIIIDDWTKTHLHNWCQDNYYDVRMEEKILKFCESHSHLIKVNSWPEIIKIMKEEDLC